MYNQDLYRSTPAPDSKPVDFTLILTLFFLNVQINAFRGSGSIDLSFRTPKICQDEPPGKTLGPIKRPWKKTGRGKLEPGTHFQRG
jgi:hypothetical protein